VFLEFATAWCSPSTIFVQIKFVYTFFRFYISCDRWHGSYKLCFVFRVYYFHVEWPGITFLITDHVTL
jgi:hypothetical protein